MHIATPKSLAGSDPTAIHSGDSAAGADIKAGSTYPTALTIADGAVSAVKLAAGALTQAKWPTASGLYSAIPAAGPGVSPFYFATDIPGGGRLFFNNGSTWSPVGPSKAVNLAAVTTFTGTGQAGGTDVQFWAPGTIPANSLAANDVISVKVWMDIDYVSNATARNLVLKLKFGGTTVQTATNVVAPSTAYTNFGVMVEFALTIYSIGAGGTFRAQVAGDAPGTVNSDRPWNGSTGTNTVALDTTASQAITMTVNESVNSVADIVRFQQAQLMVV
jgi:hypothetical protein